MVSLSRRLTRRRVVLAAVAAALAVSIVVDVAAGWGAWQAVGRYIVDLTGRAGPTRDLTRGLRRATGQASTRPIRLKVWDWWSPVTNEAYADYFGELERIFEARHPYVDVVFQAVPFGNYEQKLATAMLGDNPPDVFQSSVAWAEGFYRRGILLRLDDFARETPELHDDQFIPATLYHSRTDEAIFGIPHIADARCLMWNLDILKAEPKLHGMFHRGPDGEPDFSRLRFKAVGNWDEFRRITRLLTKDVTRDGKTFRQYGFEINGYGMEAASFMPWAAGNGATFQNRAGTKALFNTPASAEALRYLLELYHTDGVSPPFRQALSTHERFQLGTVACSMAGTWSGKSIIRNKQGWNHFAMTAFPPGPRGSGQKTLVWGNMMVISARSKHPELAWEYLRLVCSLRGALLRLKYIKQNSPRLDLYEHPEWRQAVKDWPHLENVPKICAVGNPLQHTQGQAVGDEVRPIFEYVMLNWPEVKAGRGDYRDCAHAIAVAADRVNAVFGRYARIVAEWDARRRREGR